MKSRRKRKGARGLRVVGGAASAAAAVEPPALAPEPVVGHEESEQRKIADRTKLIDTHRGQRSDLQARQARETADLIARHLDEEKQLERSQAHDLAQLWRREGRPLAGWQIRILGGSA